MAASWLHSALRSPNNYFRQQHAHCSGTYVLACCLCRHICDHMARAFGALASSRAAPPFPCAPVLRPHPLPRPATRSAGVYACAMQRSPFRRLCCLMIRTAPSNAPGNGMQGPNDHPPPRPGAMHAPAAASAPTHHPPVLIDDSDSDDCVVVSCTHGAGNTSARPQGSPLQRPTNGPGAPELTAGHAAAPSAVPGSAQKRRRTHGGSAADEAPQPSRNAIPRIHADHGACGSRDVLPAPHAAAGVGAHGASTLPAPPSQAGAPCTGKEGGAGPAAAAGTPAAIDKQSDRTTAHHSRYSPKLFYKLIGSYTCDEQQQL